VSKNESFRATTVSAGSYYRKSPAKLAHQIFAFIVGMSEFKQHKLSWIHAAQGFSVSNILHL
jgi:hypothetical protein